MKGEIFAYWRREFAKSNMELITSRSNYTDNQTSDWIRIPAKSGKIVGITLEFSVVYTATGSVNAVNGADVFDSAVRNIKIKGKELSELISTGGIRNLHRYATQSNPVSDALGNFASAGSSTNRGCLIIPIVSDTDVEISLTTSSVINAYVSNVSQSVSFYIYCHYANTDMPNLYFREGTVPSSTNFEAISVLPVIPNKKLVGALIHNTTLSNLTHAMYNSKKTAFTLNYYGLLARTQAILGPYTTPSDTAYLVLDGDVLGSGISMRLVFSSATGYNAVLVMHDNTESTGETKQIFP